MRSLQLIYLSMLLTACSTIFPDQASDKREWYSADCSGAAGWEVCLSKASRTCPNGFDTAKREESAITLHRSFEFACRK